MVAGFGLATWLGTVLERQLVGLRPVVPKPLLFLAVLGGLPAWGFTGMFLGAAAITVAWTLMHRWLGPDPTERDSATPATRPDP